MGFSRASDSRDGVSLRRSHLPEEIIFHRAHRGPNRGHGAQPRVCSVGSGDLAPCSGPNVKQFEGAIPGLAGWRASASERRGTRTGFGFGGTQTWSGFGVWGGVWGQRGYGCFPGENFRALTLSARIGSSRRRDGECAVMMKNRRLGNRRSVRKSTGWSSGHASPFFLISLTPGADPVLVSRGFKAVVSNVYT